MTDIIIESIVFKVTEVNSDISEHVSAVNIQLCEIDGFRTKISHNRLFLYLTPFLLLNNCTDNIEHFEELNLS